MGRPHRETRALVVPWWERLYRDRSVGIFEYKLHPQSRYGWGSDALASVDRFLRAQVYDDAIDVLMRADLPPDLPWDNEYWGGLDAAALYAFIRSYEPATYVEIGSGFSTRFARAAGPNMRIVSIDPQPREEIDALCDRVIRQPLEHADLAVFDALGSGDMVVLDGTHTAFMNSDSVVFFLEVMPRLAAGVVVCVDDIFLPWDYPASWVGRWYGEQYLLAQLLVCGAPGWDVVFPAWHVTHSPDAARIKTRGDVGKSFWLRRTSA
jgi:hypothetical protein